MLARLLFGAILFWGTSAPLFAQTTPPRGVTPQEKAQGAQAAREFESLKSTKILKRESSPQASALYEKLEAMTSKIARVSDRPEILYSVKVVEDREINAFTLPGGHLYIFRGLVNFCGSDDELAGVLAHEIGHNTKMHALRGQKKAKNLSWLGIAAMAAMMAGESGANVGAFSQYALQGVMNGYTLGYEKEADIEAIATMRAAGFNPAALVSFMERLERQEGDFAKNLGFLQTHPLSKERAEAARSQIAGLGIAFNPRDVQGGAQAIASEKGDRWSVVMGATPLFEIAKSSDGKKRASDAVQTFNTLVRANLKLWEVSANPNGELRARGQLILAATDADAKLLGQTRAQIAQSWRQNLVNLFWREQVSGKF